MQKYRKEMKVRVNSCRSNNYNKSDVLHEFYVRQEVGGCAKSNRHTPISMRWSLIYIFLVFRRLFLCFYKKVHICTAVIKH